MNSWVYVFSKFSSEALLIELFFVFVLCMIYASYWIIRKRKIGAAREIVPSGLVKQYLSDLIGDAQRVRMQLFGLLGEAGIDASKIQGLSASMPQPVAGAPIVVTAADPALAGKIAELEKQLLAQNSAVAALQAEKETIQKELAAAKAQGASSGSTPSNNAELEEKLRGLEERLSEYSIIEDDLANLKRLQQENAKLRAALEGKGQNVDQILAGALPAATAATAAGAPTPAPAAAATPAAPEPAAPEPAAPAAAAAEPQIAAPTEQPAFEAAVDKVEEKIAEPAAAPAAPAAAAPAATEPAVAAPGAPPAAEAKKQGQEDDLLAEFERMLNM